MEQYRRVAIKIAEEQKKEIARLKGEIMRKDVCINRAIKMAADGQGIIFGYDGDCGTTEKFRHIENVLFEALSKPEEDREWIL